MNNIYSFLDKIADIVINLHGNIENLTGGGKKTKLHTFRKLELNAYTCLTIKLKEILSENYSVIADNGLLHYLKIVDGISLQHIYRNFDPKELDVTHDFDMTCSLFDLYLPRKTGDYSAFYDECKNKKMLLTDDLSVNDILDFDRRSKCLNHRVFGVKINKTSQIVMIYMKYFDEQLMFKIIYTDLVKQLDEFTKQSVELKMGTSLITVPEILHNESEMDEYYKTVLSSFIKIDELLEYLNRT
jgi:hypothetical protein